MVPPIKLSMNQDLKQPGLFNFVLELIIYFIHVVVKLKVARGTTGLPKGGKEWEFIQDRSSYMCYAKIENTCKISLC